MRHMNRRIANLVSDAQVIESLGIMDMEAGRKTLGARRFIEAADALMAVTCHCDRYTRREVLRHCNRLHAKAARIMRRIRANHIAGAA